VTSHSWKVARCVAEASYARRSRTSQLRASHPCLVGRYAPRPGLLGVDHVHELYASSGWAQDDVTAQAGAPISVP
jgi:hypothetical protein